MTNKSDAEIHIERIAWNVEEAAAALGVNADRMGGLVRIGAVPHMMFGQRVLIGKSALERWLTDGCLANVEHRERPTELKTTRQLRGRTSAAR